MTTISWIDKYIPNTLQNVCHKNEATLILSWLDSFYDTKKKITLSDKYNVSLQKLCNDMSKYINTKMKRPSNKDCDNRYDNDSDSKMAQFRSYKKSTNKPNLVIQGGHGVGKTTTLNIILKHKACEINNIFSFVKNKKNISESIYNIINNANLVDVTECTKNRKVVVVDDVESVVSVFDKKILMSLLKLNEQYYFFPMIIVSNNQHNKMVTDIKKKANIIKFSNLQHRDIRFIIDNVILQEKIQLSEMVIDKIIELSQCDLRQLIITLRNVIDIFGNNVLESDIDEYCKIIAKKNVDIELFSATNELIYNYINIQNCYEYYDKEKVLLPLMMLQNYNAGIMSNKNINKLCDISDMLSIGDIIENNIYGDQIWDIQNVHGFYSCVYPSFLLNTIKNKSKRTKIGFAIDLNKTSIKNINKKNMTHICNSMADFNFNDIINLNNILKKIISDNSPTVVQTIDAYKLKQDILELILKIDKIDDTKISLSSKQKKEMYNK